MPKAKTETKAARPRGKAAPEASRGKAAAGAAPVGIVGHLWHLRKGLRASWERQLELGYGEERLLSYVMLACFLGFVAGLPGTFRAVAAMGPDVSIQMLIIGRLFASLIFGSLFLYAVAGLSHLVSAWAFGGQGSYFRARIALFWSLVIGMPLILLQSGIGHVLRLSGQERIAEGTGLAVFLAWAWIWLSFLCFNEGFRRRRALVLLAAIAVIGGAVALLFG